MAASEGTMRPKKHETRGSSDLFRARLDHIINMKHALAQRKRSLRATGVGELTRRVRLPVDRRRELWARSKA